MKDSPLSRHAVALAIGLGAAAAWPGGPLAFLAPALRWPLVALAVAAAAVGPGRRTIVLEHAAAALVLLGFTLVELPGLHAGWGDENAYFYMAVRVAEGELPYRDFFFAHPPLHLFVPAVAFRVAGFSIGIGQALPVAAQLVAGVLLWRSARRASPVLGLLALVLHLGAYQVLLSASELSGANLATAFAMAGLLAAVAGRPVLAGALSGLAIGTALYAAASVGAIAVACALRGRRQLLRFGAGLAAAVGVISGGAWIVGGRGFLDGVAGYHVAKAAGDGRAPVLGSGDILGGLGGWLHNLAADLAGPGALRSLALHAPILCAAAVGAVALVFAKVRPVERPSDPAARIAPEDLASVGAAGIVLTAIQQACLAQVYPYYSVPAFPWLALLAAYGAWSAWRGLANARTRARSVAAAAMIVFALHPLVARGVWPWAFPEERSRAGERVEYAWRDPDVAAALAPLSRALFWDDHRVKGVPVPAYRLALWNKRFAFSTAGEIAARVRAGSSAGETLTGASMLAPLVALLADRRLAAGEVDTNQKRFTTSSLDDSDLLRRALADEVRFVVAAPRSHFTEQLMEQHPEWSAHFVRDAVFVDPSMAAAGPVRVALYRRRVAATTPLTASPSAQPSSSAPPPACAAPGAVSCVRPAAASTLPAPRSSPPR